jgi:anti-sigma regulatory factor (Ser/Thr protein kinase)
MTTGPERDSHEFHAPGGVLAARAPSWRDTARLRATARPGVGNRADMSRLRLRLSASAEEVPFARAAITRLCEYLEIGDEQTERIRLAVTEACSNCVLHAYAEPADAETYLLDARIDQHSLRVTVCDSGRGVPTGRATTDRGLGYGLRLIHGLADSAEVSSPAGGGTRVVMRFDIVA